jgi:hypothetical protein
MARGPPTSSRLFQTSFVSGELHPSLRARTDLEQYQRGAALLRNCFVRVYGGAANRAGTRFIDYTPNDRETRLIPFAFSDDQQLCLELTDHVMRFFTGGAQLVAQPTEAQIGDAIGSGYGAWFDESTGGSSISVLTGGVTLVGKPAGGGHAQASQVVLVGTVPTVEHVMKFLVSPFPVSIRIGTVDGADDIVALRQLGPGVHSVAFTPNAPEFFVQFMHDLPLTTGISSFSFQGSGPQTATPLTTFMPWAGSDLRRLTWTQKADVLTIMHPDYPVYDVQRWSTLSWSVVVKTFAPSIEAPANTALAISGGGTGTTFYYYVVTYSTEGGEESFPSSGLSIAGADPLTASNPVVINVAQPLPLGVRQANIYKFRGGVMGYMTALPAGSSAFIDEGSIVPKTDQTPPTFRNPFDLPGQFPAAGDYWEQRLAFGGSHNAPDQVDMSQPGAFNNFAKSIPTRDSDAITMVPAGKLVRRIRHLLGTKVLYIFTDGAVFAARRGPNGVTPAMEGGVAVELARGSTFVPPVQAGEAVLFVSRAGRSVQALAYAQTSDSFGGLEVSRLSDHLLAASPIQDWAWCETPNQLLWLVREDGKFLSLAFLDQEQVFGWSRHDTQGQVESVCAVREAGEDRLYLQTRRRLGGTFRRCIEHMAIRNVEDQRDGMFLDCGLTLDLPQAVETITYLETGIELHITAHGLATGDLVDLDETGIVELDDQRFRVLVESPNHFILQHRYRDEVVQPAGFAPWLEGGVARKAFKTVAGLDHLEGLEVMVLADGNVAGPVVVTAGRVTLPVAGSRIHVGLPYTADIQTLKLAEAPDGFGLARQVSHVQLQLERTRGLLIGPSFAEEEMTEILPRASSGYPGDPEPEDWDQPANRRSELVDTVIVSRIGVGGTVCIRQRDPLPLEVLGAMPVFTRSRGT